MSTGPSAWTERSIAAWKSSAVATLTPGTPIDFAIATQSIVGRSISIIAIACGPGALPAPILAYSAFRIAYWLLAKMIVVTGRPSRAWVQSDWIVYIALPSPTMQKVRRSGQAKAAPVATGVP